MLARRHKTQEVDPREQEMLSRVRAARLKLTPQRLAIVRELASDPTHPTAQELFERLLPAMPTMSFATVYNTLDALAMAGLCSPRALAPGPARFDPNMIPHDHVVCEACGLVRDVASALPPSRSSEAAETKIAGFSVRAVETIYRGLCDACEAKSRAQPPSRTDGHGAKRNENAGAKRATGA